MIRRILAVLALLGLKPSVASAAPGPAVIKLFCAQGCPDPRQRMGCFAKSRRQIPMSSPSIRM